MTLREDALAAWRAGLLAADPEAGVRRALASRPDLDPLDPSTLVVAAGKAAASSLRGALPASGSRTGAAAPRAAFALLPEGVDAGPLPAGVVVLRGGHPHPTLEGFASSRRILREVGALGAGDRLLVLLSGGASALLEAPLDGIGDADLIATHRALVASGLPIRAINLVRGCLSATKAGRLAEAAAPAAVTTLAVSDVEGDDPAVIGSGPTVPPRRPRAADGAEALAVLRDARVDLPAAVVAFLERGAEGARVAQEATPSGGAAAWPPGAPGDLDYAVVASVGGAVRAAREALALRGHDVDTMAAAGEAYLRGDTDQAAARILRCLDAAPAGGAAFARAGARAAAVAAVFGGETTVALPAAALRPGFAGRGGRNLHLAARLALALRGRDDVAVAVGGTDGCDGSSRAAGAVVDGGTAARAEAAGFPLEAALAAFHTEPALDAAGDLLVTGPTGTNVGDLVVALRA